MKKKGIPASPGIAIGKACIFGNPPRVKVKSRKIASDEVEREIELFKEAVAKTRRQIEEVKEKVSVEFSQEHANIFAAHLLILEDPFLVIDVVEKVKKEKINVEYALWKVLDNITKNFALFDDEYIRERAIDIEDIGSRILDNLIKSEPVTLTHTLRELDEEVIIVAHSLTPSDTAQMHKKKVLAFVTDAGGRTSHSAIIARALEIPAVVGSGDIISCVENGDLLIVDGGNGEILVNPDKKTLERYKQLAKEYSDFLAEFSGIREFPAQAKDGYRLELAVNVEISEEIEHVREYGADGIGLYRTEFLYLNRSDLPSEEEQTETYSKALRAVYPHPVIIRTLDIGGDKFVPHLTNGEEDLNPFLGLRAIRLCLKNKKIFKAQLGAILRASIHGKLKIIFPMISTLGEFREAKAILEEVKTELIRENIPVNNKIEVGVMIETPSAVMIADVLAWEADFFSIGTNDLIQYTLACERGNERVAYLYNPLHPAILRSIKMTVDAGHRQGKWVGMCGEMAGNPLFTVLLLGLGLDGFSVAGIVVPEIKEIIREVTIEEAIGLASEILSLGDVAEIENLIYARLTSRFGRIFEMMGEKR